MPPVLASTRHGKPLALPVAVPAPPFPEHASRWSLGLDVLRQDQASPRTPRTAAGLEDPQAEPGSPAALREYSCRDCCCTKEMPLRHAGGVTPNATDISVPDSDSMENPLTTMMKALTAEPATPSSWSWASSETESVRSQPSQTWRSEEDSLRQARQHLRTPADTAADADFPTGPTGVKSETAPASHGPQPRCAGAGRVKQIVPASTDEGTLFDAKAVGKLHMGNMSADLHIPVVVVEPAPSGFKEVVCNPNAPSPTASPHAQGCIARRGSRDGAPRSKLGDACPCSPPEQPPFAESAAWCAQAVGNASPSRRAVPGSRICSDAVTDDCRKPFICCRSVPAPVVLKL